MSPVAIEPGHLTVKCQRKSVVTPSPPLPNPATSTHPSPRPPPKNYYINFCVSMRVDEPDRERLFPASADNDQWRSLTIPMVLDDPRWREEAAGKCNELEENLSWSRSHTLTHTCSLCRHEHTLPATHRWHALLCL